jgi:hypothetical protein
MSSPRYLAEHLIMPRYLREKGAAAALDAVERNDADFFIPVWMEAGFRFSPRFFYQAAEDVRIAVLTLPMPREPTEAWLAAIAGHASDPGYLRYFLWEKSESLLDDRPGTVLSEWSGSSHLNYGAGPPFTGNLASDCAAFMARVVQICGT